VAHERWLSVTSKQVDPPGDLGGRMRELRRRNNITLREVADAAGVSESFVSQVERGVANPSMASLRRMAEALGESVASLFVGSETPGMVVRAGDRKRLAHPAGSLDDYSVVAPGDGSGEEPYTHPADEECIIIIAGQLVVTSNGEEYLLEEGDSFLLDPKQPHSYRNPGEVPTRSIWVMSPPMY
jgi:transcriptional regulator with XRE-family HTH domain